MRIIKAEYYSIEGIQEWDVYKKHLPSIVAHLAAIDAALKTYKAHRIERGLHYLVPMVNSISFCILSPLNDPPGPRREEAFKKWRLQRRRRKAVAAAGLLAVNQAEVTSPRKVTSWPLPFCTMWYFTYLASVTVLSFYDNIHVMSHTRCITYLVSVRV
ncbi:hypothetical protein HU200_035297 [Digitaria exilis]|uniref:Uncharacterized protein n=1 Tax=Digitaria exilis TaxID=1010633 RepID=A0A835BH80_9POAL|nr:hypothetical protein HU200_035297 [Digitaria exilis]